MNVLIGKRELFAFAERYSERRLKDYTELADGAVLCSLFSAVFPTVRLRIASPDVHTQSQLTHLNWVALCKGLSSIGISPTLLNREGLQRGDSESGFSALVLFYFLFHLSRRSDFSAEFAADVSEELTKFLQSIDSIAALIAGGALPLSAVPLPLQEQLQRAVVRVRESFDSPCKVKNGSECCNTGGAIDANPSSIPSALWAGTDLMGVDKDSASCNLEGRPDLCLPENSAEVEGGKQFFATMEEKCQDSGISFLGGDAKERNNSRGDRSSVRSCSSSSSESSDTQHRDSPLTVGVVMSDNAEPSASLQEQVYDHQDALIAKERECEGLRLQNKQLLSRLTELRTKFSMEGPLLHEEDTPNAESVVSRDSLLAAEGELHHLRSVLQTTRSELRRLAAKARAPVHELAGEVIDSETGEVIDVDKSASLLSRMLVSALHDSPTQLKEIQKHLWCIVSAYHVVEARLTIACDINVPDCGTMQEELSINEGDCRNFTNSSASSLILPQTPFTVAKSIEHGQEDSTISDPNDVLGFLTGQGNAQLHIDKQLQQQRQQFEQRLASLHINESELRKQVHTLEAEVTHLRQTSAERDATWKSLCVALREVERASLLIANAEDEEEVKNLLEKRRVWCVRAEEKSALLLREEEPFCGRVVTVNDRMSGCNSGCATMQELLQTVTWDRDRLLRELEDVQEDRQKTVAVEAVQLSHKKRHGKVCLKKTIRRLLADEDKRENQELNLQEAAQARCSASDLSPLKTINTREQQEEQPLCTANAMPSVGCKLSALLSSTGYDKRWLLPY
uniref:Calponin-homology (CH) domain-containing protein n=1 Tax=Trypanosoma congolense (strain IL3000) TaxID=1068625 RepID=G0UVT2_TRYCI|nr:conserved hypothetical protein [Trypanosoma congolense IL3000]